MCQDLHDVRSEARQAYGLLRGKWNYIVVDAQERLSPISSREVVTDIINNKHMKVSTLDHMQYYAGRMDPPQKSPDKMVTKC